MAEQVMRTLMRTVDVLITASFNPAAVGAIGVGLVVAAEPLVRLFTDDAGAVRYSVWFVRASGLAAIPQVLFLALSGSLQGAGETRLPFLARAVGVFGFMLGFSYVAGVALGYGPVGAYVGITLSYLWMAGVVAAGFARSDWAGRAAGMLAERDEST